MHETSYFQPDGRIRCKWSIIEPWDRINIVTFSHHPSLIRRIGNTHSEQYCNLSVRNTGLYKCQHKEDGLVAEGLYTTGSARILPTTPPASGQCSGQWSNNNTTDITITCAGPGLHLLEARQVGGVQSRHSPPALETMARDLSQPAL